MFKSKTFKENNYFVLYDLSDNIICYYDNFNDLSRVINYSVKDLVHQYNRQNTNNIIVVIDSIKYRLATFC